MVRGGRFKYKSEPFYPIPYYAVGDLYLTTNSENPSERLGYGTWSLFGPGRTIVCVDTSQSEFNTVKKTGGEKTHTLITNEIPQTDIWAGNTQAYMRYSAYSGGSELNGVGSWGISSDVKLTTVGGNQAHNNLQPFITCYIWLRTA